MDEIKQIYLTDTYSDFLRYCDLHNYRQMRDLRACPFDELPDLIGISPALLSRIKMIYVLYQKNHPECFAAAKAKTAKPKAAVPDDLSDRLLVVFQQNANKLIHISEITKALGKGIKRSDIISVLERQPWCKIVDNTTFFYSPAD